MSKRGTGSKATQAANAANAPQTPNLELPTASTLTKKEAAELAGIDVDEVFAVNEYSDRTHVITTDGQKHVVAKK